MTRPQLPVLDQDKLVAALLSLPKKNLESRVREIESEISKREHISSFILTQLNARRTTLEDQIWKLRYAQFTGRVLQHEQTQQRLMGTQESIHREMVSCFHDLARLSERLQESREQLVLEEHKLLLLGSDNTDEHNRGN